jgi:hypothetical protein
MLNAEVDLVSEDEDQANIRPVKRPRVRSPSPQLDLDDDEERIAGLVADEEHVASDDDGGDNDANNYGLSDDAGNEEMAEDLDVGGYNFGGGMNNGVISLSFMISYDV